MSARRTHECSDEMSFGICGTDLSASKVSLDLCGADVPISRANFEARNDGSSASDIKAISSYLKSRAIS